MYVTMIGTKAPSVNGGFAFAWPSSEHSPMCPPSALAFMTRTTIKCPKLKGYIVTRDSQSSQVHVYAWKFPVNHLNHWWAKLCDGLVLWMYSIYIAKGIRSLHIFCSNRWSSPDTLVIAHVCVSCALRIHPTVARQRRPFFGCQLCAGTAVAFITWPTA